MAPVTEILQMRVAFLQQPVTTLASRLSELAATFPQIDMATAFLTKDGLNIFDPYLSKSRIKIVCGVSGSISDLHALKFFVDRSEGRASARVFAELHTFHPKIYIFQREVSKEMVIIIGSANVTGSGLKSNEEACAEFICSGDDPFATAVLDYFAKLWELRSCSLNEFLELNPEYRCNQSRDESLPPKHLITLEKLRPAPKDSPQPNSTIFAFSLSVNTTFYQLGKQTIPMENYSIVRSSDIFRENATVYFKLFLPSGEAVDARFSDKHNNSTPYCEFQIRHRNDTHKLQRLINNDSKIEFTVDLGRREIKIQKLQ